jgi:hypothetical protein
MLLNNSGIYFHIIISLSVAKISQWNGLLLYWVKIHFE